MSSVADPDPGADLQELEADRAAGGVLQAGVLEGQAPDTKER